MNKINITKILKDIKRHFRFYFFSFIFHEKIKATKIPKS